MSVIKKSIPYTEELSYAELHKETTGHNYPCLHAYINNNLPPTGIATPAILTDVLYSLITSMPEADGKRVSTSLMQGVLSGITKPFILDCLPLLESTAEAILARSTVSYDLRLTEKELSKLHVDISDLSYLEEDGTISAASVTAYRDEVCERVVNLSNVEYIEKALEKSIPELTNKEGE